MITCIIKISEIKPLVVAVEMKADNANGTEPERRFAGALDIAVRTALVYLAEQAGNGQMIEGEDIEHHIRASLQRAINA